jgi:hypothetical protein
VFPLVVGILWNKKNAGPAASAGPAERSNSFLFAYFDVLRI